MADYLASIFGTEKDKVNCSFYFKMGACRHGDKCSKVHNKPTFSQTVLLKNLYVNPLNSSKTAAVFRNMSDEELQQHFDEIFEELFVELEAQYGEIEEMNICDNLSEHLAGNTYVKFRYEEDSEKACQGLNNRWFNGKPIYAELSPVTDFHESCCRQFQMGECPRGGFCNFMHLKPISYSLRRKLYAARMARRQQDFDFDESAPNDLYIPYFDAQQQEQVQVNQMSPHQQNNIQFNDEQYHHYHHSNRGNWRPNRGNFHNKRRFHQSYDMPHVPPQQLLHFNRPMDYPPQYDDGYMMNGNDYDDPYGQYDYHAREQQEQPEFNEDKVRSTSKQKHKHHKKSRK